MYEDAKITGGCPGCMGGFWMHAIIVVLLIFIIYKITVSEKFNGVDAYGYLGHGLADTVYTSGATLRRLGQVFSSTNQGYQTTVYNAEIKDAAERSQKGLNVVMFPSDKVPANLVGNI